MDFERVEFRARSILVNLNERPPMMSKTGLMYKAR